MLLVDAAQTAGVVPIDMQAMGIDLLAFTGHKGLQGPPGTGGLVIGDGVDTARMEPVLRGGTGSRSEFQDQPEYLPDKYECGTPNGVGLAGLLAGIRWVTARGVGAIREHQRELTKALIDGLCEVAGVKVYGPHDAKSRTAVVSFTVADRQVSEIGLRLDQDFEIFCRVGLHCSPAAHTTIGTFPEGSVRLAPGASTSLDEVRQAVAAVARIVGS